MNQSYTPPESLSFRANLAQLVSPLRRVRTRTPFFRLAAHRIPTLWSLYRGLLRNSPTEEVKFRVRLLFRQSKQFTGVEQTRKRLTLGYKYLDFFKKATSGDEHCQKVMIRYSDLIAAKREKTMYTRLMYRTMDEAIAQRNTPIYTGSFIRPSLYNVPLPRMKPQPLATTMIYLKRRKARQRRYEKKEELQEYLQDLQIEQQFEEELWRSARYKFPRAYSGYPASQEWKTPINDAIYAITQTQVREYQRAAMKFPPDMVAAVFEARRERIRNKTREKERERKGEILRSTLKRRRKAPPPHILSKMTPKQREMDKVARSLSEVGYVALVKRRLGFKLKDPEAGLELGEKENRPILDQALSVIRAENANRAKEGRKLLGRLSKEQRSKSRL
ncbi:hypothetical protein CPC08DRAFT_754223 [Agrocybe pediades]|nr:hypothetical protein CPC08DRAFT_754223 [Agrocybe pediades]